jgi:CubicO group peptidase (beta-lactamase class C family)
MKKKWWILVIAIAFAITHLILVLTHKEFIYKALVYNYPDINDQNLFYARVAKHSSAPESWAYNKSTTLVLPDSLQKTLAELESTALLVIQDDSIVFEKYYNDGSDTTHSGSFSVAKSFIGTLIGIAVKKGFIKSIDEPVANYLPDFKTDGKEKITIRHCLMMSSGLSWDEAYASAFSITTEAYYGTDLRGTISRLKAAEAPGVFFSYKSGDTQVLSLVLAKATGKSTTEFMQDELWSKIGSESDAWWSLDDKGGVEKAYCCIYATARDFARLGKLYLNRGKWNGEQILDEAYVQSALKPNRLLDKETSIPTDTYGLQWWIYPNHYGKSVYYARGILGQYIIIIPESKTIIVRLGHKRGEKIGKHPLEFLQLVNFFLLPDPTEQAVK